MSGRVRVRIGEREFSATVIGTRVTLDDGTAFDVRIADDGVIVVHGPDGDVRATQARSGDHVWVGLRRHVLDVAVSTGPRRAGSSAADQDALAAPMAATVVRIAASPGARVGRGDLLIALEAMKMELPIRAPRDGVVAAIHCREGELVQQGAALVELEPEAAS